MRDVVSFDSNKAPLPFIHDHRLSVLVNEPSEMRSSEIRGKLSEHGNCWKPVPDRTAFLADVSVRLRVVTVSAGAGKTVAAMQTQYLLQQVHSDHVCLLVKFSQLPETAEEIWGLNPEQSCLVRWFRETEATKDAPRREVARLIAQKIAGGKFTLIVDAFDQTTRGRNVHDQAGALQKFLEINAGVRCVCTGRQHAIVDQFWNRLFYFSAWQFVRIEAFDEAQSKRFLDAERWELCQQLEATELFVPRSLEAIRKIPRNELNGVRTASQIYWRSILHTFEAARVNQNPDNLKSTDGTWEILNHHALQLFSLLAFECNRQRYLDGVRAGEELHSFLRDLWSRHTSFLKQRFAINSLPALEALLIRLGRLNASIDFAAFDHTGILQVVFQNRTLQDFFAAIWICTNASDADFQLFTEGWFASGEAFRQSYYQMWARAAEMPSEPKDQMYSRIDRVYMKAIRGFYESSAADKPRKRQTEMIWRSWAVIEEISMQKDQLNRPTETAVEAKTTLDSFLNEYPSILYRGSRGAEAQKICEDFETWFVNIDPNSTFGLEPFQIAKHCVTNELFNLFDDSLETRYRDYDNIRSTDFKFRLNDAKSKTSYFSRSRAPAVLMNWYEAFCIAKWLRSDMPTQKQLEFCIYCIPDAPESSEHEAVVDQSINSLLNEVPVDVDRCSCVSSLGLHMRDRSIWHWSRRNTESNVPNNTLVGGFVRLEPITTTAVFSREEFASLWRGHPRIGLRLARRVVNR